MLPAVAGCTAPINTSTSCMPPACTRDSPVVAPGETLGISAPDALCNPGHGEDALVRVELVDARQQVLPTRLAPMSDAGSFAIGLRVPAGTTPGAYGIAGMPDRLDSCGDTGRNNRLGSAGTGIEGSAQARASWAMPRVGFRVAK
ncbi:hypothetical protein DQ353_13500 [Arthrobacter sp. AQ5-05]|nr:hypothetical protein DQ353_13500 [Arthrobacter sp. AQ5-05]